MFHAQGRLGRIVAAVALTTVLSLAGPVRASAAVGRISSADPWSWLKGWWQGGVGVLVQGLTPGAPAASVSPALQAKDTVCPPTGCPLPPNPNPLPGQGGAVDPDGRPH